MFCALARVGLHACVVLRGGRGGCECGHRGQWTRLWWWWGVPRPRPPFLGQTFPPGPLTAPGSDPGGSMLPASRDLDTCQPTSYFILAPGI